MERRRGVREREERGSSQRPEGGETDTLIERSIRVVDLGGRVMVEDMQRSKPESVDGGKGQGLV